MTDLGQRSSSTAALTASHTNCSACCFARSGPCAEHHIRMRRSFSTRYADEAVRLGETTARCMPQGFVHCRLTWTLQSTAWVSPQVTCNYVIRGRISVEAKMTMLLCDNCQQHGRSAYRKAHPRKRLGRRPRKRRKFNRHDHLPFVCQRGPAVRRLGAVHCHCHLRRAKFKCCGAAGARQSSNCGPCSHMRTPSS